MKFMSRLQNNLYSRKTSSKKNERSLATSMHKDYLSIWLSEALGSGGRSRSEQSVGNGEGWVLRLAVSWCSKRWSIQGVIVVLIETASETSNPRLKKKTWGMILLLDFVRWKFPKMWITGLFPSSLGNKWRRLDRVERVKVKTER